MLVSGCTDEDGPDDVKARVGRDLPAVLARAQLPFGLALPDPDYATGWLCDHVFTDKSYRGDGVYRVPPEAICDGDAACIARVLPLELRVRVDGNELFIQLDDAHDEPVHLTLGPTLDAELALDDRSLSAVDAALGSALPTLPASGSIALSLGDITTLNVDLTAQLELTLPAVATSPFAVTMLSLDGSVRGDTSRLEVTAGSLAFVTDPVEFGVSVERGQCVTFAGSYAVTGC